MSIVQSPIPITRLKSKQINFNENKHVYSLERNTVLISVTFNSLIFRPATQRTYLM